MKPIPPAGAADIHFIGNATLLVRYGALTLLTDPNFLQRGQYAYLGKGLVSKRVAQPAITVTTSPWTWTPWCSPICTVITGIASLGGG